MLDTVIWKKGRYLIPIFFPFLTHFLIGWLDGDNQALKEDEIGLYWMTGILLGMIWCLIFSKPHSKYSIYLISAIVITASPLYLVVADWLDRDIYSQTTGIGNIFALLGMLAILYFKTTHIFFLHFPLEKQVCKCD